MRKCFVCVIAISLLSSGSAFAQSQISQRRQTQVANLPAANQSPNHRLDAIMKQLRQINEDEMNLRQARADFNRLLMIGVPTLAVSSYLVYAIINAYRYRGENPSKFTSLLKSWTAQKTILPAAGVVGIGTIVIGAQQGWKLQNEIDSSLQTLKREKADLEELYQSAAIR